METNICRILEVDFKTKTVQKIVEIKTTMHLNYDEYNIKMIDENGESEFYYMEEVA